MLLVFVSIVLTMLLVEAGVRLFLDPPVYTRFESDKQQSGIESEGVPNTGFYQYTPLGTRLKAGASGFVRNHRLTGTDIAIRTNSFGFRGPEIIFDDRERALFLGDSITLADYLPEEQTFVHLVGELSKNSAHPLQTINAGVGAIGIEEEWNILRETGHSVKPAVVVLNLYLNDMQASEALHLMPIPKSLRWSWIARWFYQALSIIDYKSDARKNGGWIPQEMEGSWKAQAAYRFPPGPGNWQTERPAYNRMMLDRFDDWGSAYSDGGQERILGFARQIIELSRSIGAQPMVVIHPTRFQVEAVFDANEPQRAFVDYFSKAGVPVLDLLPVMRKQFQKNSQSLFYDQCHHNPNGSILVASQIYTFIAQSTGS